MRLALAASVAVAALAGCPVEPPPPLEAISGVEPLSDDQGWSIHLPPFDVPPGVETQDCFFFAFPDLNGDGSDVWVDRFKLGQKTGSHHMNIFRKNSVVHLDGKDGDVVYGGECRISSNWSDWPLVVNTQESIPGKPAVDWQLPEGVAQKFTPGEILMVQTHYVNADLQPTPDGGEVRVNFYKTKLEHPVEMGTLFATQQAIRVCQSRPEPHYVGSCGFASGEEGNVFHLAAMNGHFHSRGTSFKVYPWDGISLDEPDPQTMIYESTTWDEPPMAIDLDVEVPNNGGIVWSCDYKWEQPSEGCDELNARDPEQANDCCYTFGNSALFAEHCNVFAYYWPKTEDINCN